jgi:uncharacterized membrane protein
VGTVDRNRLEAFSDGVLAIAITLLVLDLPVPAREGLTDEGVTLLHTLTGQWPKFAAYLVSFVVIGIIWVNHHSVFAHVRRVDRPILFANLALLLVVSFIPWPTKLFADYVRAGGADARTAAVAYSLTMLAMAVCFTLLWLAVTRRQELLLEHLDRGAARAAIGRFGVGTLLYGGTVVLALANAPLTLLAHFAIAVYYCFDQLSTRPGPARPDPAAAPDQGLGGPAHPPP